MLRPAASVLLLLSLSSLSLLGIANVNAAPAPAGPLDHPSQLIFSSPASSSSPAVAASEALSSLSSIVDTLPPLEAAALIEHIRSLPEVRTVALSERPEDTFAITEGEKALLTYHGVKFVDVTGHLDPEETDEVKATQNEFPSKMKYGKKELEKKFFREIDMDRMKTFLRKFSSFRTRYYRSSTGKESQQWLLSQVRSIASSSPSLNMSVVEFPHSWGQNSIIARLPATSSPKGRVIIGAHQDSTNLLPFLGAPGADDDGSGTTTIVEVMRVLVGQGWRPETYDVEWHFYSAEEGGMLGSGEIAQKWAREKKAMLDAGKGKHDQAHDVRGMLQMDMTAYIKPGTVERIGIVNDFVSPSLTGFIKRLIEEYATVPWVDSKCGYACSDHTAWTKVGVDSAFAIEATFEDSNTGNIHSGRDTIDVDGFSFDHMRQFVRLATAFVLELSS